jgi:hypothetical protein
MSARVTDEMVQAAVREFGSAPDLALGARMQVSIEAALRHQPSSDDLVAEALAPIRALVSELRQVNPNSPAAVRCVSDLERLAVPVQAVEPRKDDERDLCIRDEDCAALDHWEGCPEHYSIVPVLAAEPEPVVTVRMLHRTPNHAKGQLGTLHDASPSGHVNERVKWVDYGEPIQWSFGQSESTGEWCGPGEYEVVPAAEEVSGG